MPSLPILPSSLPISTFSNRSISSCRSFNPPNPFLPLSTPSSSSFSPSPIRMGGGPRTFPGGVSKWQWKRMQAKKSKQLLKARLCRERQLYEMRKRAELKSAITELERPWEVTQRAPVLFSVSVDEQIKALADRFQRPCGFDMWTEKDGPQIFTGKNRKELGNLGSFRHVDDFDRSSHGLHLEQRKEDREGEIRKRTGCKNTSAGGFDRRRGNRGSFRANSEISVVDSRSGNRNASAGAVDRRLNRNSFGSDSEIRNVGFRKGRIRNTEGDDARSVRNWRDERDNIFRSSRGRGRKD